LPRIILTISVCLVLVAAQRTARASVIVSEDFETYNTGILDKNAASTANPAPNGSGNPWWGPGTNSNVNVVGAQGPILPHSGSKMIRPNSTASVNVLLWNNIAYRNNAGHAFAGDLEYSFWFFDPNGTTNGTNFENNSALVFYADSPGNADYPSGANPTLSNSNLSTIQRLTLGAANFKTQSAGAPQTYDSTKYQARLIGYTLGFNSNGWANLPLTRSVGWHHGKIEVGPADITGNNSVSYYIDNMLNPLLTGTTNRPNGYNNLEFVGGNSAVGYFDDITLTPEPTGIALLGAAILSRLMRRPTRTHA